MSENTISINDVQSCPIQYVLAINESLNVLTGKWKMPIIGTLIFKKKRFTEIQRNIPNITARMLSKELKDLELNGIIKRTVYDTIPVSVEYELTESAELLKGVVDKMLEWGMQHRARYIKRKN